MCTSKDLAQYKVLCEKAQALAMDYQRVLQIRTKERDDLAAKVGPTNVIQLTPTILHKERRAAANSIIKIAMRRVRQTVGHNARIHQVLYDLLDEDKGSVDIERPVPPKARA
jgi:hypothetical protein